MKIKLICKQCGKEFEVGHWEERKFCSRKCHGKWMSEKLIGKEALAWNGGKLTLVCKQCGCNFEVWNYEKNKREFCSRECTDKWYYENPRKQKDSRITLICESCGKEFKLYVSQINGRRFCSEKCYGEWMKENIHGENASNWQGGLSYDKYCQLFNNRFKEKIRNLYNRRCFLCGKTEEENGRNLDVHHVNYDKDCLCGSQCEFVPLCMTCHRKTNGRRIYWEDLIMNYLYPEKYFMIDI